jgi:hypothetical protein
MPHCSSRWPSTSAASMTDYEAKTVMLAGQRYIALQ